MAIAAEPSSPSIPPSAADWAAISVAAASETSVTAFATVAITVANKDDHPRDGRDINDCLHDDGHDDVIVDDGLTLSHSPLVVHPVDLGN